MLLKYLSDKSKCFRITDHAIGTATYPDEISFDLLSSHYRHSTPIYGRK